MIGFNLLNLLTPMNTAVAEYPICECVICLDPIIVTVPRGGNVA